MRVLCTAALAASLVGAPAFAAGQPVPAPREPFRAGMMEGDGGLGPLYHATMDKVRARLGDPDVSRAEGRGAFWTYRLPHCALFLFFHEGPRGLHVTSAATGPRKRGEPTLSVEACLASAVQLPEAPGT